MFWKSEPVALWRSAGVLRNARNGNDSCHHLSGTGLEAHTVAAWSTVAEL